MTDDRSVETRDEGSEILAELVTLFETELALAAWGRLLVEVVRVDASGAPTTTGEGELRVADVSVEDISDDARVGAAFESPAAHAVMRAVAAAIEALSALEGVDPIDAGGATFFRTNDANGKLGLAFVPGRVRATSPAIERERAALGEWVRDTEAALARRFRIGKGTELRADMETGLVEVRDGDRVVARGTQVVLGSFSRVRRSWVWGAHNPSLDASARLRAAALLDALPDRGPWEIATPGFTADEPTAWALAALVARHHALEGVARVEVPGEGFVLFGVSGLAAVDA
ncbi:MAG TPA: hypothetical protein VL400_10760 [Polyangiaceae bacterium]|nr:hypothetical protein [Polyangiaceae bacterium]